MSEEQRRARPFGTVWAIPVSLAMLSIACLAVCLLGSSAWQVAASVALAAPVAIALYCAIRSGRR